MFLELRLIAELLFLGLVASVSLFLLMKEKRLIVFLVTPLVILSGIDSYNSANALLGFSRPNYYPDGEVTVMSLALQKKEWIHIWYFDVEGNQPRAIKIPQTPANMEKARQIAEKLRQGQQVFAEFKGKGNQERGGPFAGFMGPETKELIFYEFSTRYNSRKNPQQ